MGPIQPSREAIRAMAFRFMARNAGKYVGVRLFSEVRRLVEAAYMMGARHHKIYVAGVFDVLGQTAGGASGTGTSRRRFNSAGDPARPNQQVNATTPARRR